MVLCRRGSDAAAAAAALKVRMNRNLENAFLARRRTL
jgi:hypothetical protein